MPTLKLLGVASKEVSSDDYKLWQLTAEHFAYDYTILGRDKAWNTFNTKITEFYQVLCTLDTDYVVLSDMTDLFFVAGPEVMISNFEKLAVDHIIGGEVLFSYLYDKYDKHKLQQYFKSKTTLPHCYPNGGFFMGKTKTLCTLFASMLNDTDDQAAYINYAYEHKNKYHIDYITALVANISHKDTKPCQNNTGSQYFSYNSKLQRYVNNITGTMPVAMHFPGKNYDTMFRLYNESMGPILGIQQAPRKNITLLMIIVFITLLLIFLIILYLIFNSYNTTNLVSKPIYS